MIDQISHDDVPFPQRLDLIRSPVPLSRQTDLSRVGDAPSLRVPGQQAQAEGLVVGVAAAVVADGREDGADAVHDAPGQVQSKAVEGDDLEDIGRALLTSLYPSNNFYECRNTYPVTKPTMLKNLLVFVS